MQIPLFKIGVTAEDVLAVNKVLARGNFWAEGPEIEEFEQMIAEYIGTEYAVVFNSGTSALHAVMLALGIRPGQEVIVPAFTFAATANAPGFVVARPVFADIESSLLGLDVDSVRNKITSWTRAIMPVHYAGRPCDIIRLKELADEHGLFLIEDACEAFGASVDGKKVGSFGDVGVHSFCQSKIITTGEGGAVTLNNKQVYLNLLKIRSHGQYRRVGYDSAGYNWRMPSMNAALGVSQLSRVEDIIRARVRIANRLVAGICDSELVSLPSMPIDRASVFQMFPMFARGNRDKLMAYLSEHGIASKVYFPSLSKDPLPVTDEVSSKVLCIHPTMTEEEIDYVIEVLK